MADRRLRDLDGREKTIELMPQSPEPARMPWLAPVNSPQPRVESSHETGTAGVVPEEQTRLITDETALQSPDNLNRDKENAIAERATRRHAVVDPILEKKLWRPGRLATEAGVGKNSVYQYLDGTRAKITPANRKAIAEALGTPEEQLPE